MTTMTIDEAQTTAKTTAKQLVQVAYGAQPVRQPDGTTLALCYTGRLHRAYRMLADATAAGDAVKAATLQGGIDRLAALADEAMRKADEAVIAYSALATAAGNEPDDLSLPDCMCAGCKEAGKVHRIGSAMGRVRQVVWDFMGDDGDGAPEVVTLVSKGDASAVQRRLQSVVAAMQDYIEACKQHDVAPNWRELWA